MNVIIYFLHRDPSTVDLLLEQEIIKGYNKGPFDKLPFSSYRVTPIGIAESTYIGKKRLIVDLSSPYDSEKHSNVNNLMDKELCSLPYVKIDDAVHKIKLCGQHAILNMTDVTNAISTIPTVCVSVPSFIIINFGLVLSVCFPFFL